jgi:O-antigen/teichoic acid export membrane protein
VSLNLKNRINIIFGLQFSQILRFVTFLIISAVFTKQNLTGLTKKEIGDFELMMLLASALSFFWVTGIIQSFLPLYNNNHIFQKRTDFREKSPEIFNTFLLLTFFSVGFALLIYLFRSNIYVYKDFRKIPHVIPLIIYFILSNITPLVEYIYYVRNRPYQIVNYVFWTSSTQVFLVCGAVILKLGIDMAIWALIAVNVVRFIWLLVLLERYAEFKYSFAYMRMHLKLGMPLVVSCLLSGSSQYIDGFIASWTTLPDNFASFRYGAKELPFASSLANGLGNGMLTEFSTPERTRRALYDLKKKSLKMMHYLFPITIVIMLVSKWIFGHLFNESFLRSADVFMVYLLMIISRFLFPQTILIGLKKTRIILWASIIEIALNILASVYLSQIYDGGRLGLVGIALGTVLIHILEKVFLIGYNYYFLHIPPKAYIPLRWFLFYSILTGIVFALVDHRILALY